MRLLSNLSVFVHKIYQQIQFYYVSVSI